MVNCRLNLDRGFGLTDTWNSCAIGFCFLSGTRTLMSHPQSLLWIRTPGNVPGLLTIPLASAAASLLPAVGLSPQHRIERFSEYCCWTARRLLVPTCPKPTGASLLASPWIVALCFWRGPTAQCRACPSTPSQIALDRFPLSWMIATYLPREAILVT